MMNSNKRNIIETENDAQTVYCILTSSLTRNFCVLCMSYLSLLVFSYIFLFVLLVFRFFFFFFLNCFFVAFALLVERTCANYVWLELILTL